MAAAMRREQPSCMKPPVEALRKEQEDFFGHARENAPHPAIRSV